MTRWTPTDDALLRDRYGREGASATLCAQLGRTATAVRQRARVIGLPHVRRPWTPAEDARLRRLWTGTESLAQIARRLGRTRIGIYERSRVLGLRTGAAPGHELLTAAAARTGYEVGTLRRILSLAGVHLHRARVVDETRQRRRPHWYVEPFDCDEAVAAWHRTETMGGAARRRGIAPETLRRWLHEAGVLDGAYRTGSGRTSHYRVESDVVDRVVAARRRARRAA